MAKPVPALVVQQLNPIKTQDPMNGEALSQIIAHNNQLNTFIQALEARIAALEKAAT